MSYLGPLPSQQHAYPGLPALDERALHERREQVFLVTAGLFLASLALLNVLGITRFLNLAFMIEGSTEWRWKLAIAVGVLPYPITFLCTDFISELYGRRRANFVVFVGLLVNLWVVAVLWLGGAWPGFQPPSDYERAFFTVRQAAFGAVTASMIAYVFAQFVDVYVFHFWKEWTRGKHLWLRNNGSTLISQLVDTTAVILITYYAGGLPIEPGEDVPYQLLAFIATGYTFKAIVALLDTIPFYFGAHYLARYLRLPPPDSAPHPPAAAAVEAGVG